MGNILSSPNLMVIRLNRKDLINVVGWLFLGILVGVHALYYNVPTDDGYIVFRYARNIADGYGPVWNIGERVEGYTSPAWTLLLGITATFTDAVPYAAQVLGLLSLGLMALSTVALAHALGVNRPAVTLWLFGCFAPVAFWALGGLETCLFGAIVTWAVLITIQQRYAMAGLAWGMAYLVRPEGVGLFGVTIMVLLVRGYRNPRSRSRILAMIVIGGTIILAHVTWRLYYYGVPLPNTFYAKVSSNWGTQIMRGVLYIQSFAIYHLAFLLCIGFSIRRRSWPVCYLFFLLLSYVSYILLVGGDGLFQWRFIVPIAGILVVLASVGLESLPLRRKTAFQLAALIGLSCLLPAVVRGVYANTDTPAGERGDWTPVQSLRDMYQNWDAMGQWLGENIPEDYTVAVRAAGYASYYGAFNSLDSYGLNNADIAHRDNELGSGRAGHERFDLDYVLAQSPDIFLPAHGIIREGIDSRERGIEIDADALVHPVLQIEYQECIASIAEGVTLTYYSRHECLS